MAEVGRRTETLTEREFADDIHGQELQEDPQVDCRFAVRRRVDLTVDLGAELVESGVDKLLEIQKEIHRKGRADPATGRSVRIVREGSKQRGRGHFLHDQGGGQSGPGQREERPRTKNSYALDLSRIWPLNLYRSETAAGSTTDTELRPVRTNGPYRS